MSSSTLKVSGKVSEVIKNTSGISIVVIIKKRKFGRKRYDITVPLQTKRIDMIEGIVVGMKIEAEFYVSSFRKVYNGATYFDTKCYLVGIREYKKKVKEEELPETNQEQDLLALMGKLDFE
jgi:hypothetical protein